MSMKLGVSVVQLELYFISTHLLEDPKKKKNGFTILIFCSVESGPPTVTSLACQLLSDQGLGTLFFSCEVWPRARVGRHLTQEHIFAGGCSWHSIIISVLFLVVFIAKSKRVETAVRPSDPEPFRWCLSRSPNAWRQPLARVIPSR